MTFTTTTTTTTKNNFTTRPVIMSINGVVTAGHYLAAPAGLRMLQQGGNAFDAAAATAFCLAVLEPHLNGIGGEVPILAYSAKEERVVAISGQGQAPLGASIGWFRSEGIKQIPGDGLLPAVVPAMVGTWILALETFGTMRLRDVLAPAIELADNGYPVQRAVSEHVSRLAERFRREWPSSARIFLPNGRPPIEGEVLVQKDLAGTLRSLVEAERSSPESDRKAGLDAVMKLFYEGPIARALVEFNRKNEFLDASGRAHSGFLEMEDFARFSPRIEEPLSVDYKEYTVFKCGPWTQGPVFLQQLRILEGFDLTPLGHNSPDYIHLVVEAAKLAFADREEYYGDPDFDRVPITMLLSKEHGESNRRKIDLRRANLNPARPAFDGEEEAKAGKGDGDTTHLDAIDKSGNMVAATQSGGWILDSPVVDGLGFPLGTRGQMFYLDGTRNNSLAPGKRPRITLTPSLAFKGGRPFMVFGTPGGDGQDQWTLEFFLNLVHFGMNLQQAIDAPSFHTLHFPNSFYPREAETGKVVVEGRIPTEVRRELERRGHTVVATGDWENGRVLAIERNESSGVISGAASPKGMLASTAYALGW